MTLTLIGEAKPNTSAFEGFGNRGKSPVSAARRREMFEALDAALRRSRDVGACSQTV